MMFSLLGIILTILGLVTAGDAEMYARSLGHNVNLWSGLFMLVFGAFMLLTSRLVKRRRGKGEQDPS